MRATYNGLRHCCNILAIYLRDLGKLTTKFIDVRSGITIYATSDPELIQLIEQAIVTRNKQTKEDKAK
jgi:hypothetical protein